MSRKTVLAIAILVCCFTQTTLTAQVFSTKGKQFYVSFMENSDPPLLALFFSADKQTQVSISVPGRSTINKTISPSSTDSVVIAATSIAYNTASDVIRKSGIYISADNPISVYAFNTVSTSTDATLVLPLESLGSDYYTFNHEYYSDDFWGSEIMVIGVSDNTRVEITPKANLVNSFGSVARPANVPFTITLNKGDVYFAKAGTSPNDGDLSGTRIRGASGGVCTGFAVFSGHLRTPIPLTAGSRDHLFEQMFPTNTWGQKFLVAPFVFSQSSEVRITARKNGTVVDAGSAGTFTLNAGQVQELTNVNGLLAISASGPIGVVQYMKTVNDNNGQNVYGDPFLMWIAPVEQVVDQVTINAFDPGTSSNWSKNMYVSILFASSSLNTCSLDGTPLSVIPTATTSTSAPAVVARHAASVDGTSYSIYVLRVKPGNHTIVNPSGVVANVYALADFDSYGFLAGAAVAKLDTKVNVFGLKSDSTVCPMQNVTLRGSAIDSDLVVSWKWILPNGNRPTTQVISTSFPDTGLYKVPLIVERNNGCRFDTVYATVRVKNDLRVKTADTAVCLGTSSVDVKATRSGTTATVTYTWVPVDAGVTVSAGAGTATAAVSLPKTAGIYKVRVFATDADGCVSPSDTSRITLLPVPQLRFSGSLKVCEQQPTTIAADIRTGTQAPYRYKWFPASGISGSDTGASMTAIQKTAGTYTYLVQVTDARGCSTVDSIVLNVTAAPSVYAGNDVKIICIGDSTELGTGGRVSGGTLPYQSSTWRRVTPGAANITNPNSLVTAIYPGVSGIYVYEVTDVNGCVGRDSVFCDVRQIPDANAGPDFADCVCGKSPKQIGIPSRCGDAPFRYSWRALGGAPAAALNVTNAVPATLTVADNPLQTTVYQYELTVSDASGRSTRDTLSYSLHPCPVVDAGAHRFLCGPAVPVNLQPAVSVDTAIGMVYQWTPAQFLDNPNVLNPRVTLPDSNLRVVYTLRTTTMYGCSNEDTVVLQTSKALRVTASVVGSKQGCVCRGDSVQLTVKEQGGTPPYTYSWSGANLGFTTFKTVSATPVSTTTYQVLITDARGCSSLDSIVVCVEPVPNPKPASDTTICSGEATPPRGLPATCGKPPFRYQWTPGAGVSNASIYNPVFSPTATTTYTLTVTDDNGVGVSNAATMTIRVNPLPVVSISRDTAFCAGGTALVSASVTGGSGSSYTYEWFVNSLKDQQNQATAIFSGIDSSSRISCRVTDGNSCAAASDMRVTVFPGPRVQFQSSLFVCPCQPLQIGGPATGGTPGYNFLWRDIDGGPAQEIDDSTSATPTVRLTKSRTYVLTVSDSKGCITKAIQSVVLGEARKDVSFVIPDVVANPRDKNVAIPIAVGTFPQKMRCPPTSLDLTIVYDPWLFDPSPRISQGTILSNTITGKQRELRIHIAPVPMYSDNAVITTLTGAALLGEPGYTRIAVKDVRWECSSLVSDTASGLFTLDPLCKNSTGNTRLLSFGTVADIVSIVPNPAKDVGYVTVRRTGADAVHILLSTLEGTEVLREEWPPNLDSPGTSTTPLVETKTIPLHVDSLAQGVYRCVLQTSAGVVSDQLIIIR